MAMQVTPRVYHAHALYLSRQLSRYSRPLEHDQLLTALFSFPSTTLNCL